MRNISKVLPLSIPPSETYQGLSFMMGVVLNNENIRNEFYNTYINLQCNDRLLTRDIDLCFTEALWEDFRVKGIVEMDLYYVENLSKNKCLSFFIERIDQDNYLLLYNVDEFYLPYSQYYKRLHYTHDMYIYGYDTTNFYVMAYKDKKLEMFQVEHKNVIKSLYKMNKTKRDSSFCSLRPYHKVEINIDDNEIAKQMSNYINGYISVDGMVYGIRIYDVICNCLCNQKLEDDLDARVFRMLWEHKKVFVMRYSYLNKKYAFDERMLSCTNQIITSAYKIFMFSIKFNQSHQEKILMNMRSKLQELKELEYQFISNILERIKNDIE